METFTNTRQASVAKSIRRENRQALLRRWRFARAALHHTDPLGAARCFPGHKELFGLLASLNEQQVLLAAEVDTPLFAIHRIRPVQTLAPAPQKTMSPLELDTQKEFVTAMTCRLTAALVSVHDAAVAYGIPTARAAELAEYSFYDVLLAAQELDAQLSLAVHVHYFQAVAHEAGWSEHDRFALATATTQAAAFELMA